MVDKNEWINKLQKVIRARGGQVGGASMRHSLSEGSLVSHTRTTSLYGLKRSLLNEYKLTSLWVILERGLTILPVETWFK